MPYFAGNCAFILLIISFQKWGSNKEDLQTVTITSIGSSKQMPSPSDFFNVKYKLFGTEIECTAAINLYKNCRLRELLENNNDQIESTLKPLKYLYEGHNDCWDIPDVHSKGKYRSQMEYLSCLS